jgi:hypothetical protein
MIVSALLWNAAARKPGRYIGAADGPGPLRAIPDAPHRSAHRASDRKSAHATAAVWCSSAQADAKLARARHLPTTAAARQRPVRSSTLDRTLSVVCHLHVVRCTCRQAAGRRRDSLHADADTPNGKEDEAVPRNARRADARARHPPRTAARWREHRHTSCLPHYYFSHDRAAARPTSTQAAVLVVALSVGLRQRRQAR